MRLFVAVWPDDATLDQLAALERPAIDGVRWTSPDQWHITLRFFGDVEDPSVIEVALQAAAAGFGSARGPGVVRAEVGPAVQRVGNMLWAPVSGLDDLAGYVVSATAALGAPPEDRPFRGHITLARHRSRRKSSVLRAAQGQPLVGSWNVNEVELVQSHLGPEGSRYEAIARVPLRPNSPSL
jgi:RNA 2',3'-cyclic 3'-phosphodiesterase